MNVYGSGEFFHNEGSYRPTLWASGLWVGLEVLSTATNILYRVVEVNGDVGTLEKVES